MPLIIGIAVVILAISLRNLISMENSLEEGRGPQREILLMTIPMMALVVSLMLMMANKVWSWHKAPQRQSPDSGIDVGDVYHRHAHRANDTTPRRDTRHALGAIFLVVPILLIAVMVLPSGQRISDEEE